MTRIRLDKLNIQQVRNGPITIATLYHGLQDICDFKYPRTCSALKGDTRRRNVTVCENG